MIDRQNKLLTVSSCKMPQTYHVLHVYDKVSTEHDWTVLITPNKYAKCTWSDADNHQKIIMLYQHYIILQITVIIGLGNDLLPDKQQP